MHFNFHFTTVEVIWTLTFAAHLVLLVVLMGRERIRRFPWFTAAIVLTALRLLASRLLFDRLPRLTLSETFIVMADLSAIIGFLVLVEVARRVFGPASRRVWIAGTIVLLAIGGTVVAFWGKWPAWKTISLSTLLGRLEVMQLFAQRAGLLVDSVTVALGVVVILFGRRFGAGLRSHPQQIMIGLSTASVSQLAVQTIWQRIATNTVPHSMAEYQKVMDLREKIFNANGVVFICVLVWWIVCLWIDEPGATQPNAVPATEPAQLEDLTGVEGPGSDAEAS
ncbi:MAG TPA: hypothetical protein VKR52_07440 [Terracidiphilus sp.]|nr:hypothetical protein [Terracidiphilus sp.]